jgi:hypothetical protein
MPSFGNFKKSPPVATPQSGLAKQLDVARDVDSQDEARKRKKKRKEKEKSKSHSGKSKKGHKNHHDEEDSLDDEDMRLWDEMDRTEGRKRKKEEEVKEKASPLFSIRRLGDKGHEHRGGIHKLDKPDYDLVYEGVVGLEKPFLGGESKSSKLGLSIRRSGSNSSSSYSKSREEQVKTSKKGFEGRYFEKGGILGKAKKGFEIPRFPPSQPLTPFGSPIIAFPTSDTSRMDVDTVHDNEQQSLEMQFLEKNRKIGVLVAQEPHNIDAWFDLISLQDEYAPLVHGSYRKHQETGLERNSRIILEKKLNIFSKALDANPDNLPLIIGKLETLSALEGVKESNNAWIKEISKNPSSGPLWLSYLRFTLSNFSQFSISHFRSASATAIRFLNREKANSSISIPLLESHIAQILILYTRTELESGYSERAIAIFQALIEINFFAPSFILDAFASFASLPSSLSLSSARTSLLSSFRLFWEAKVPKYGQKEAKGWNFYFDSLEALKPSIEPYDPLISESNDTISTNLQMNSEKKVKYDSYQNYLREGSLDAMKGVEDSEEDSYHEPFQNEMNIDGSHRTSPGEGLNSSNFPSQNPATLLPSSPTSQLGFPISPAFLIEWSASERSKDEENIFPLRPDQMLDDPESVILFEDMKDYLVYFCAEEERNNILRSFFQIFGIFFKNRLSTSSPIYHSRILHSSNLSDCFYILEQAKYPPLASIRPEDQNNLNSVLLPPIHDFLDTCIVPRNTSSSELSLMRFSLEQLDSEAIRSEIRQESKICLILLDGEPMAKSLLQSNQSNVNLWNAYLCQLMSTELNPKKINFIRRTYSKLIPSFLMSPSVIDTIRICATFEYRMKDTQKALHVLQMLSSSSLPPIYSNDPNQSILFAHRDLEARIEAFKSGISANVRLLDPNNSNSTSSLYESLDVYFSLVIVYSMMSRLMKNARESERAYLDAKNQVSKWKSENPDFLGSISLWMVERWRMYELDMLVMDYDCSRFLKCEGTVKMGDLRNEISNAIFSFPSNHYFLSLISCLSLKTFLSSHRRIIFSKCLSDEIDPFHQSTTSNESPSLSFATKVNQIEMEKQQYDWKLGSDRLMIWLFAIRSEFLTGSHHRIHTIFEKCLNHYSQRDAHIKGSALIWKLYLEFEISNLIHRYHGSGTTENANTAPDDQTSLGGTFMATPSYRNHQGMPARPGNNFGDFSSPLSHPSSASRPISHTTIGKSIMNLLYRAIQACPWSKSMWIDFLRHLAPLISSQEISQILQLMEAAEVRIREKLPL